MGMIPGYTNLTLYAWYYDNSGGTTHPVGQKLANPWGLHDMHGMCGSGVRTGGRTIFPAGLPLTLRGLLRACTACFAAATGKAGTATPGSAGERSATTTTRRAGTAASSASGLCWPQVSDLGSQSGVVEASEVRARSESGAATLHRPDQLSDQTWLNRGASKKQIPVRTSICCFQSHGRSIHSPP